MPNLKPYPYRGRFDLALEVMEVFSEEYDIETAKGVRLTGFKPVMRCRISDMKESIGSDTEVVVPVPSSFLFDAAPGAKVTIRASWDGFGRGKRPHLVKEKTK